MVLDALRAARAAPRAPPAAVRRRTSRTRGCSSRTPRRACSSRRARAPPRAAGEAPPRSLLSCMRPKPAAIQSRAVRRLRLGRRRLPGRRGRRSLGATRVLRGGRPSRREAVARGDERCDAETETRPARARRGRRAVLVVVAQCDRGGRVRANAARAAAGAGPSSGRPPSQGSRRAPRGAFARAPGTFGPYGGILRERRVEHPVERRRQRRIDVSDARDGRVQVRERLRGRRASPYGRRPVRNSNATTASA